MSVHIVVSWRFTKKEPDIFIASPIQTLKRSNLQPLPVCKGHKNAVIVLYYLTDIYLYPQRKICHSKQAAKWMEGIISCNDPVP